MSVLDNLLRRSAPTNFTVYNFVENVMATVGGMDPAELYETQDALRAVVDFIADSIASCPLKVYTREGDNDRVRDTTSDWAVLLKEPNDHETTYDFINKLVHELLLWGDVLILRVRDANSRSGWTVEVIPQTWIISTKTNGFVLTKYQVLNPYSDQPAQWYDAADFIRIHGYETGQPGNTASPVAPLKNILQEQINAWAFRNQVWDRGGRTTAFLTRPADAGEWTPEQRDRFVKAWREKYAGNSAPDAGSMPLLEDGMEIKSTPFNARETGWAEALTLSRESVAGVYHVNPTQVWAGKGGTYASAKENARSLYVDCLGPRLEMISQAFNRFLLPALGAPANAYCEFDIKIKLSGSFEEQSDVMVRATGTAYQTINETRALMNLPRIDDPDADQIVKPMNVIFGGQASPLTPTGDGSDAEKAALSGQNAARDPEEVKDAPEAAKDIIAAPETASTVHIKGTASTDDVLDVEATFRRFYKRQAKSVINAIDRSRDKGTLHEVKSTAVIEREEEETTVDTRDWYDLDRWDRELRDDLIARLHGICVENVKQVLDLVYADPGAFSDEYVKAYIEQYCADLAHQVNLKTFEELVRAVDDAESFSAEDALKSTPKGVFEYAEETRAKQQGKTVATSIRSWSSIAAVHLSGKQATTFKTWRVRSVNPRPQHAKMDGEQVPYQNPNWCQDPTDSDHWMKPGCGEHQHFSNGLRWPGDYSRDPKQVAGCQCELDLEVRL